MFAAFLYSAKLYVTLCLQSLRRRHNIGHLTLRGRLLRILIFVIALPVWLLHWICLLADEILFPGYRRQAINRPLFILGVPRSGTTFLHRTLSQDTGRFTTVSTWEVFLAPSILQKKFWLGLATLDRWLGGFGARGLKALEKRLFRGLEGVHDVALEAAEEDYLLLLPLFSCFILFLPFTESRHIWQLARFDWEASEQDKRRIMRFYKACLQKHMYVFGADKRYLSKNAAFASWPQTLHQYFPDADFVVCMREPEKAVPSLLGSLQSGASFFELDLQTGELPGMLVEMMGDYYSHLLDHFPTDAPIVHMRELKSDIINTIEDIYAHFGEAPGPEFQARLLQIETEASQYRTQTHAIDPQADASLDFYQRRFSRYYSLSTSQAKQTGS